METGEGQSDKNVSEIRSTVRTVERSMHLSFSHIFPVRFFARRSESSRSNYEIFALGK